MSSLSHLKGVRTRYRNILTSEMKIRSAILSSEVQKPDEQQFIIKASKCAEKIKLYVEKLEFQSGKLCSAMDEASERIDSVIEEDCSLCSEAMDCYLDVNQFKERSRWIEFWDSFESSVHKNTRFSKIEKFNYLKGKLQGEAKRAVSGLSLSNDNYDIAVKILEERFGNKQDVIDLHYNRLINLPSATQKTSSLREFLDKVKLHLRSLEVLQQDVDQNVFISIVKSKLPEDVLLQLEIQKGSKEKWTVFGLCDRLTDYVTAKEKSVVSEKPKDEKPQHKGTNSFNSNNSGKKPFSFNRNGNYSKPPSSSAETLVATTKEKQGPSYFDKCRYCGERHWSDECKRYQTIEERKRRLKGSCFKCLREGHNAADCRRNKMCIYCEEVNSHHRSLCPKKFSFKTSSVHMSEEVRMIDNSESRIVTQADYLGSENRDSQRNENVFITVNEMVLMQTAKTIVRDVDKVRKESTRVLFDSGSQRTYISQNLAERLGLKRETREDIKLMTFGSEKTKIVKTWSTTLELLLRDGKYFPVVANIEPVISVSVQRKKLDGKIITHLKQFVSNVELADDLPYKDESSNLDLLIGSDYYLDLVLSQRIEISPGLYLLASKLGWIITGRTKDTSEYKDETGLLILSHASSDVNCKTVSEVSRECELMMISEPNLTDFWNLESIGITDQHDQIDDIKVMSSFKENLKFENGRYYVSWPWKEDNPELPVNRSLAFGRLKSCLSRMRKKPEQLKQYDNVIKEQLQRDIIEKVEKTEESESSLVHYIPHHAVVTPQKSTTKLRIVYDASSKTDSDAKSLNECLHRGPVMLHNLCGMLMRFRLHQVADIEKAFLQVGLQQRDRDVTRFLWIKDIDNPTLNSANIEEYRFCRVPFGVISSPFLLGATIDCHLNISKSPIADKIRNDIYVDNLITGASSVSEAINVYTDSKQLFRGASMNLREWISNNKDVNSFIPENDMDSIKVLGHVWNVDTDTLSLKSPRLSVLENQPTKRTTLKLVAEVFDPLGLFNPVTVTGKVFLQDLWEKNLKWDDKLEKEDTVRWQNIYSQLMQIITSTIPRCITIDSPQKETRKYNLLCFCDASAHAYAICIYLHEMCEGVTKCNLIFSKVKLAPVKGMTIPRLELMAVLIGVRSLKFVECELKLQIEKKFLWTDSQCVLKWISTSKKLTVFVKNRVAEIKKVDDIQFDYIPTKENPADVATRGKTSKKLTQNRLWWHGPVWLNCEPKSWNVYSKTEDEDVDRNYQSELKKIVKESIL